MPSFCPIELDLHTPCNGLAYTIPVILGFSIVNQGKQLLRQRSSASKNIGGTVQVDRLILLSFYAYLE